MPPDTNKRAQLDRHLRENEAECIKHNIIVHVDKINSDHSVAFCTVEQRLKGFFRVELSVPELIWRAEQALAPLNAMGIMPLLTIRHRSLIPEVVVEHPRVERTLMDWIPDLWRWLGYPLAPEGFGAIPVRHDPFGWKQAFRSSAPR